MDHLLIAVPFLPDFDSIAIGYYPRFPLPQELLPPLWLAQQDFFPFPVFIKGIFCS